MHGVEKPSLVLSAQALPKLAILKELFFDPDGNRFAE
jgi:hypothetical protein